MNMPIMPRCTAFVNIYSILYSFTTQLSFTLDVFLSPSPRIMPRNRREVPMPRVISWVITILLLFFLFIWFAAPVDSHMHNRRQAVHSSLWKQIQSSKDVLVLAITLCCKLAYDLCFLYSGLIAVSRLILSPEGSWYNDYPGNVSNAWTSALIRLSACLPKHEGAIRLQLECFLFRTISNHIFRGLLEVTCKL